jgi:hypothetical protein
VRVTLAADQRLQLLAQAITQAAAAVTYDTSVVVATEPALRRTLRFGSQTDTRIVGAADVGNALSPQAVANYIAKYATKTTGAPGLPDRPVNGPDAIARLLAPAHYKRLITICWELGKLPEAAALALNRWTHMLGYRGHFLTKSRRYSVTFTSLRQARVNHRRAERHPEGDKDPWGRDLDDRVVLIITAWQYAGTGHATTAEQQLALAAAARAREHDHIARQEARMT